jgi:hypothetical protein
VAVKKKNKKLVKLVLAKETVRSLEKVALNEVVGGSGETWHFCLPDSIHDVC